MPAPVIDTRFIDVDFQRFVVPGKRLMGDITDKNSLFADAKDFSESIQTPIPRSEWKDYAQKEQEDGGSAAEKATLWVHDQNGDPSCVSNAMIGIWEEIYVKQFGLSDADGPAPKMSAMSLYNRVGSPNSGSSIDTNVREMATKGALPLNDDVNKARFSICDAHNGYGRNPSGWEEVGKDFRIDDSEIYKITDLGQFVTALYTGWGVIYARDGHCILAKRWVLTDGGTFVLEYLNSWGVWGTKMLGAEHLGNCAGFDSESKASRAAYGYACRKIIYPKWKKAPAPTIAV